MKKIVTIAILGICVIPVFAQNRINQTLDNIQSTDFKKINPFIFLQNSAITANIFEENYQPSSFNLDSQILTQINAQTQFLEINLPISTKENIALELYEANIFAENFKLFDSKGQELPFEKGVYFRGRIKGDNQSICAISITNGEVSGFISDKNGNKILKKLQNGTYSLYDENKLLDKKGFACSATENDIPLPPNINATPGVGCKIVDIYIEADNQLYLNNNSSIPTTTTLVTTTFNQVATLYSNENIEIRLSGIKVWNTADPYPGTTSGAVLNVFRTTLGTTFTGTLAHLFSGRSLGGGVAYVDVLDYKLFAFGVSIMSFGGYFNGAFTTSPVGEITHELGHNFGSSHTHNCTAWAGGAIDNCYTTEGGCAGGPTPAAGGGTIMSYCHLSNAIGTNYANGFGPLPGALIRANVLSATGLATSTTPVAPPTASSGTRCGAGAITLTANGCAVGSIKWYNSLTGGTLLGTTIAYSTTVSASTSFYASCTIGSCVSARQTYPVTVSTIIPASPTVINASRCGSGTVALSGACGVGIIPKWVSAFDIEGTVLGTGNSFTTPIISTTTTYLITCSNGACSSNVTATATVNPIPAIPTVSSPPTIATNMATSLSATGCSGTVEWFVSNTSITPLATGIAYTTPLLAASTTYYYTCKSGLCSSPRGSVLVNVSACPPTITMLSPTHNLVTGTNPYETSGVFSATNKLTGGNTKYDSASSITLNPGFEVSGGATFRAIIDGCGGSH